MSLVQAVRFESLAAVREEIREWLGPEGTHPSTLPRKVAARDALVSVLIHHLAQELSDVRVRSQIQALLSSLPKRDGNPFAA